MYKYRMINENVLSDIELKCAYNYDFNGVATVNIFKSDEVELHSKLLEEGEAKHVALKSITKNSATVYWPGCGTFFVEEGKKISYVVKDGCDETEIEQVILCVCLPLLAIQRNMFCLHGSGLVTNNKITLISGDSGSGKSTLAASLINRGYKYITDDILPIEIKEKVMSLPTFPVRKLCEDALLEMNEYDGELIEINDGDKYKKGIKRLDEFINEPLELANIIIIKPKDTDNVSLRKITGPTVLQNVINCLFRISDYEDIEIKRSIMQGVLNIAKVIDVYEMSRPIGKMTVNEQIEVLGEIFCEHN